MAGEQFGRTRFKKWANVNEEMHVFNVHTNQFTSLIDHAFIADCAPVWSKELDGHEVAIISRTYAKDELIDNPPAGLKVIRLPKEVMGVDDLGTAIAIAITSKTKESEKVLQSFTDLPTSLLSCVISREMADDGYYVGVFNNGLNEYSVKLKLKQERK